MAATRNDDKERSLEGRIRFEHGLPADDIEVRLYQRSYGCAESLLGSTHTDENGAYRLSYTSASNAAHLEVRVVDAKGKEVALSATRYNARSKEVMNLVAPARVRPPASEHERLSHAVAEHLREGTGLAGARENRQCQDISLLSRATRWDARLVALLATAARLSHETGIGEEALYALLRNGLPTNKRLLAHVPPDSVASVLKRAVEANVVGLSDKQVAEAKTAFRKFARKVRRASTATGAASNLAAMLRKSGLARGEELVFENLLFEHNGTGAELWKKAARKGISEKKIGGLQLQGKLAYLTLNNAGLTELIQKEVGAANNLGALADSDLYQGEGWEKRLRELAGNSDAALRKLIPPAYKGGTTDERLKSYSADLARKVRLSLPTQVVARMIEKDELHLGEHHAALKKPVNTFLKNASDLGFSLGRLPINKFIKQNHSAVFKDIAAEEIEPTKRAVKKLQRLYQITPTDDALKFALDAGFNSAHDVAAMPFEAFMQSYGDKFSADADVSRAVASQFYRKAQQVASVTYNFFTSAKQLDTTPSVYALSPPASAVAETKNELIKHYPTMESLFGSLDFCECEACRSVLSPAAYFVDLLQFLNPDKAAWNGFLAFWKSTHGGEDYTAQYKKAYDALVERRPDLPHLQLTCENTNTAMPYIDVVNEILEYYLAEGALDAAVVHDTTGEATTPELLAEPQNIRTDAYTQLIEATYPLGLPFDLWLETVRRFCAHFGIPLWKVLDTFRATESLFLQPADTAPYGLSSVFVESLGVSPAEYALITNANPQSTWHELYGFDDPNKTAAQNRQDALAALASAKTLSLRLGLSYKQLVELVRTGFVNPQLNALVILGKLGVEVSDVFTYKSNEDLPLQDKNSLSDEQLLLLGELNAFDQRLEDMAAAFPSFDVKTWLDDAWQQKLFDKVLVLADPDAGCNFDATTLRYADGTDVDDAALIKLNLFVRIWKKLGWTLEETDRALQALVPSGSLPLTPTNVGEALKTALVYLAHFKQLEERLSVGKEKRAKLLTLWSNLPTTGSRPLYAQLFLTRNVLKQAAVFDDPLGNYLSQGDPLKDHTLALQAALSMTASDIADILTDSKQAVESATLSLENVSTLYRYGLLAKALKVSVRELITLKTLSGLDPFKPLSASPPAALDEDYPLTQTLRFVEAAATVKESGLAVEDLDYLFRHRFDPVGKYQENPDDLLALVRSLASELERIRDEQAVPDSLTDEQLRQKLALALTPDALAAFLASVTGTAQTEASADNILPAAKLDPKSLAGEPRVHVSYNDVLQRQTLTYRGPLLDADKDALHIANPSSLLETLLDDAQSLGFKSLAGQIESVPASLVDTTEYHAVQSNVSPADSLDPEAFADEPSIRVAYDEARSVQRLTWRGLLLNSKKNALESNVNSPVLSALLDSVQSQAMADAGALISASLAMLIDKLDFNAVKQDVQLAHSLDPKRFDARFRVDYDGAPAWDASANYQADEAVSHADAIWVAKRANTGVEPLDGDDWGGPQGRRQSLSLRGLLSDSKRTQVINANPSNGNVLSDLLDDIQNQAGAFLQKLRIGLLASNDFDTLFDTLPALFDAGEDPRARLAKAVSPFVVRDLTNRLIVQTMASTLDASTDLVEALVTNAGLLTDPADPGSALVDAFAAAGDRGVSATFFDNVGATLETRRVASPDTADKPVGAERVRFEGYIQVPSAGPYRFFASMSEQNAAVELQLGGQTDPLIRGAAPADNAELSAFVELKQGVSYASTFNAANLNGGRTSLLVQGENLPKGTLERLTLSPSQSVERVRRARVLLSKSLELIEGLGLTVREAQHLLKHAADFDGVSFNQLPTNEAGGTQATTLFDYFQRLVEYVRLKREVAGDTDDLIGIFENARRTYPAQTPIATAEDALFEDLCERFADLARRDAEIVSDAAMSLKFTKASESVGAELRVVCADFASEKGVRRLWDALQAVETLGVGVAPVVGLTGIIDAGKSQDERFDIAADLRNMVKARYEPEAWLRIAPPIFDELRQARRDALVARIMHRDGFERVEELFEFFLVDPGMEPVVQTSRLRLAISSVQLFIQRCLLNLETEVHPSAINSEHWEWMKRYRVWEANRKIFLFPENWLEPEFRDDKTHLFTELEGTLLQGDVSNDLAEDALFTYLQKLEEMARLDIVAMYCEEMPLDPASNTIHVIGRTFGLPHKYFYRRYRYRMWTPWEPLSVDIDGDHLVAVVWRQRLNLFWVTFMEKAKQDTKGDPISVDFNGQLNISSVPPRQVDVQLNWTEYFQGQWTTRGSSGFATPVTVDVANNFSSREVFIFAVKEYDDEGEEAAVRVQLSGEINLQGPGGGQFTGGNKWLTAFRVVSRHAAPEVVPRDPTQPFDPPYITDRAVINRYSGSDALKVSFIEEIKDDGGPRPIPSWTTDAILKKTDDFSLLAPDSRQRLVAPEFAYLISPFFFEDRHHTFFVEPTLTEKTFVEWEDWAVPIPIPDLSDDAPLTYGVPEWVDPGGPVEFDPLALYGIQEMTDWITSPQTVLQFDDAWVGRGGGVDVLDLPGSAASALDLAAKPGGGFRSGMIGAGGLSTVALKGMQGAGALANSTAIGGKAGKV
jgi:hypothetical protein